MFEDALMESGGRIKTSSPYWSLATLALNGMMLTVLILWPLLNPEGLPWQSMATILVAPPPPQSSSPPAAATKAQSRSVTVMDQLRMPTNISDRIKLAQAAAPPSMQGSVVDMGAKSGDGSGDAMSKLLDSTGKGRVVQQVPLTRLKVSSGVMTGNLLQETMPQYPPIAKAVGISGTVVLEAIISKSGTIDNLRVISGPPMLQRAALDAVRTWRYKPYLLNGEPVQVESTVNVVFDLGR